MPGRYRVPMTAALTAMVATLALAGCGKSDDTALPLPPDSTSPTASPSPSASGPIVHPTGEKEILAAYTGMWMAYAKAGETGDTSYPGLQQHATGAALKAIGTALITTRARGIHGEGYPVMNPWVVSAMPSLESPAQALVKDCSDTTNWLQHDKDGSVVAGDKGGHRVVTATVALTGGTWKVTDFQRQAIGSC